MKVTVVSSDEDMEIISLKAKVKLGGNIYEDKYSFWARFIPSYVKNEYELIKKKTVEELSLNEIQFLEKYYEFMQLASLQMKIDGENFTKLEYIEYLKIRCNWPLETLRYSKLSEYEIEQAGELMKDNIAMSISESKNNLTVLERYLKEVLEEKSFKYHIEQLNRKIQYRMNEIDAMHFDSYELSKTTRML